MPYATMEDVQRRMPQFQMTAVSKPSVDAAQVFLDDTHAQLDAALENMGYTTPVTGDKSLKQVLEIVCQGTIAKILYARASALGTDVAVKSADRAQKQYDDALANLWSDDHPAELVDALRTDDAREKPGTEVAGLTEDENGLDIEPRITMDTKF